LPQLERALRDFSDDRTVTVDDEPMRVDLLDILLVIDADPYGRSSYHLRVLSEALQEPIVGGKF
jgi:hypothetical protein